jgi:hypothetical protein
MTPRAIKAAPSTASCSAHVRTWPVSVMTLSLVSAVTSLPSGNQRRAVQRLLDLQVDVHRVDAVADFDVVPDVADTGQAGNRRLGGGALRAVGHGAGQGDVAVAPSATRSSAPSWPESAALERSIRLGTLTSLAAAGVYPNMALKSHRWIRDAVWLAGSNSGYVVPGERVRERNGASRCRWP